MQLSEICAAPDPLLKDWSTWSGRECKAWLMEHGISGLSKMTAEELKAEVKPYMTGENRLPIPDVVNNPGRDLPYSVMRKFLLYTNLLFGTIMLSDLDGFQARNRAQALVSLFLSSYDMIDQALIPSRSLPIWIAKYNMLGLLRVPEHFERHRHFRNQYEGGLLGEAMVKDLRNICPNAVRQNWSKNMVQKFYRNQALDAICNEACVAGTPVSMTKFCTGDFWQFFVLPTGKHSEATLTEKIQRNFRRYKSISDVQSSIEAGWPLSVIVYRVRNTLCFALVLSRGEKLYLRFIKLDRTKPTYEDTHGYIYFTIEVDPNSTEVSKNEWPNCGAFRFQSTALMLPDLWHHDRTNQQYKYTFVNDDWRRLDNNLNWTVKI